MEFPRNELLIRRCMSFYISLIEKARSNSHFISTKENLEIKKRCESKEIAFSNSRLKKEKKTNLLPRFRREYFKG